MIILIFRWEKLKLERSNNLNISSQKSKITFILSLANWEKIAKFDREYKRLKKSLFILGYNIIQCNYILIEVTQVCPSANAQQAAAQAELILRKDAGDVEVGVTSSDMAAQVDNFFKSQWLNRV